MLSSLAELALQDLALCTHRRYRDGQRESIGPTFRHSGGSQRSDLANSICDLVSIVEAFVTARYEERFPEPPIRSLSNWKNRESAWDEKLGSRLNSVAEWRILRGFVEVRNAIQHGSGRLTDQQLGKYKVEILKRIGSAEVRLNGPMVVLLPEDLDRCHGACAGVVRHLG